MTKLTLIRSKNSITTLVWVMALLWSVLVYGAPRADAWPRWEKHNPQSTLTVDHSAWTAFIQDHQVLRDGVALLDYAAVDDASRTQLHNYIHYLTQELSVDQLNRDQQRAYWINLYNALTITVILDHYPVKSIRDIRFSWNPFTAGPWSEKIITIAGEKISLDDIEHRILRPLWRDPRVHYAVNCASIGCPNLAAIAYTADNTEDLLTSGAHAYINHQRGVTIARNTLTLSSIYDWFQADFGGSEIAVIAHLKQYAAPALKNQLDAYQQINNYHYDWSLNQPDK